LRSIVRRDTGERYEAGTNPIRQTLANLDEAGSLYGAIIYDKAPIVMRQLEIILAMRSQAL
jgi:aminopeptidase N